MTPPAGEESHAIDRALVAMHEAGARAHPTIPLDAAAFARFARPLGATAAELSALHAADLYLAAAAALGEARAVAAIEIGHLAQAPGWLARKKVGAAELDEVLQRARERLFVGKAGAPPKIAEYAGRGPLGAWLRVLVLREEATLRRRTRPHEDLDEATALAVSAASPEQRLARARWQAQFDEALRAAFASLAREDRALFRFQFAQGLTLDQIANLEGVHRATVARRIAAARKQLWSELCRVLRDQLGVSQRDLDALIGEWRSKLDVSLSGLLRATGEG